MDHLTCDRCGAGLLLDADVRYEVKIEVKSAYDPMEISEDDLKEDQGERMRRLLRKMEDMTEQEAMDQVFRKFSFDLCFTCQKSFVKNPLGLKPDPDRGPKNA